MAYCGPARLEHAAFRRWEPLSQALALEWHRREQEQCPGCGLHPELTDPERGGDPSLLSRRPVVCEACALAEGSRETEEKSRMPGERRVWRLGPPESAPQGADEQVDEARESRE